MARSLRIQYPGAFYHITCRGNQRQKIFIDDQDRHRFLALLSESLATYQVVLYAHIMMSNHFHILVQTLRANLSEFMRRFNICYTGWFNYRHHRCGHLYQGRYKAFLIDADNYLLEVSRYLHLNCVRIGRFCNGDYRQRWQYARQYRWSSLPGYLDKKKAVKCIDYDFILSLVGSRRDYQGFMVDGLRRGIDNPFDEAKSGLILGNDDFVVRVKDEYIERGSLRDQPSYRSLMASKIEPGRVVDCVAKVLGIKREQLLTRFGGGIERGFLSELLYQYSGLTERAIGQLLGSIDYSAVNKLRKRLSAKIAEDKEIADRYAKVADEVQRLLSNVEI